MIIIILYGLYEIVFGNPKEIITIKKPKYGIVTIDILASNLV